MDNILEQLPDQLADGRAAQRLLSVLDKLEASLKSQRKNTAQASNAEIKQLRDENLSLRFRQAKARERLDTLLEKLPGLFPDLAEKPADKQEAA